MYKILRKEVLNPTVTKMVVDAPLIAKKAEPGQFIILRTDENGERIPMTHAEIVQLTLDIEREACPLYEQAKGSMLSGVKKYCLLFLDDVLPLAQYYDSVQWVYAGKASPLFLRYTVYNTVFTAIFLTSGILIFKRKDLN